MLNSIENGRFDVKFLDAALTRLGVSQAIDAQPIMSKIPIKYVITSPLRRTLETTRIIFANHPNKEQILIIVNPIILECMEDPGDIPNWTLKTWKPKYDDCGLNYDFSMMSKINLGLYFLENFDYEAKEAIANRIKMEGEQKYPEVISNMMNERRRTKPKHYRRIESYENVRRRAKIFLDWIKKFAEEKHVKLNEIAVVTHSKFIRWTPNRST